MQVRLKKNDPLKKPYQVYLGGLKGEEAITHIYNRVNLRVSWYLTVCARAQSRQDHK